MNKFKAVSLSIIWSLVVIAFPVCSGVIIVISKTEDVTTRLVQTVFMLLSMIVPIIYCSIKKIEPKEIYLTGIDKRGVVTCGFYLPLLIVLLPMLVMGLNFHRVEYTLATLLFTCSVGIAEELYFRGIIIRILRNAFSPVYVVIISSLIFGFGHVAGAFVENNLMMVALNVLNAVLFGWLAAEIALLSKNIIALMIFHALFDFFTYQMLAGEHVRILIYAIRGSMMFLISAYLLIILVKQKKDVMEVKNAM